MLSHGNINLVIVPPDKMEANIVTAVAAIFNKDIYQTRQMLCGKMPKLIACYRFPEEAEVLVNKLKGAGLMAFTCEDTFLRQPPPLVFSATTLHFNENEITFQNQSGTALTLSAGEIFLILKGNKQINIETEHSKAVRKLSIGKTIITGGIPIFDKVKQNTTVTTIDNILFLRIYTRSSADPRIEILQQNMDYKFLGPQLNYSSLANFNTVANEIKKTFPSAIFDDRLMQLPRQEELSSPEIEFELNCRLLYLFHQTLHHSEGTP